MRVFQKLSILLLALTTQFTSAAAQPAHPNEAEKAMAALVNCNDWKRNPDGSWTSGENVKIGNMTFSSSKIGPNGMNLNGADVATVLEQKCGGQRL